jgi:hypothetical protein
MDNMKINLFREKVSLSIWQTIFCPGRKERMLSENRNSPRFIIFLVWPAMDGFLAELRF